MSVENDVGVYREALVFLGTAGVLIPVMTRFRVSPVLGFLVAGLVLGPHSLGRIGADLPWLSYVTITSQDAVDRLAELGVAFLLFTIGLELSFDRLWTMRRLVFGLGMSQVVLTTAAISGIALIFGNTVESSLVIGACLALSSTAIVLQLLAEQKRLATVAGRSIFAVLLAQDLAVVPILFLIVVFGKAAGDAAGGGAASTGAVWLGLAMALVQAAAAILLIIGFGRLVLRRLFRLVASTHNRELFMATILFVVVGTSLVTHVAGLSMALGAFLAGLVLAETEFRRQVEVDIEPFKGMLLGLFFISVGMRIDLAEVARYPAMVATSVIGMTALKALVIAGLTWLFRLSRPVIAEASLLLAGGGEFAFLVLGLASSSGLVTREVEQFMLLVSSGTMMLTPYLARLSRKASARARKAVAVAAGHTDPTPSDSPRIILVGYGRVGRIVGDILNKQGKPFIGIDVDPEAVARARKAGVNVVYGDATQRAFLRKCGLGDAPAVVVTMHDAAAAEHVVAAARAERADLPVIVRARDADHAARLFTLGATEVIREVLEASFEIASTVLQALGMPVGKVIAVIHDERDTRKKRVRAGVPAD
ncbi:cation:proton antiporter [Rhodopseudomonas palustris]|uniref:Cation:proton antiporter n=1 Tax=Rhodopseudomonas palustris (strain ATCC BAA-98 / CGA009) TaxID=258594 RepID=Q6N350_RHOPA|nr:cation:proton antiporter [Rhodopseudomonas palustris]OPF92734.1 potassium transporter TrkA [Rhodopseudomonas palustris]PPQ41148.1 potassium transporter TrkA [Rhodopseudomonas palustris]QLH72856.1 cation:proton antiporter [Rhodopseudomonas palustris]QQM05398.1 Glutathione-regulated potassium-efflux system protein KefC [Rhodopseudomonas palustris]RHZ99916.1 potassium transporter TrkA [Rhodopseudomonas palustris]